MDYNDTFPLHCERFSIHALAGTRTSISPNQGYLIPLCEQITLYLGETLVPEKIPWMDTFTFPWSFTSEIEQEVEFIRIRAL